MVYRCYVKEGDGGLVQVPGRARKTNWTDNIEALYRRGKNRLFFDLCGWLLQMFYQSGVASTQYFVSLRWPAEEAVSMLGRHTDSASH